MHTIRRLCHGLHKMEPNFYRRRHTPPLRITTTRHDHPHGVATGSRRSMAHSMMSHQCVARNRQHKERGKSQERRLGGTTRHLQMQTNGHGEAYTHDSGIYNRSGAMSVASQSGLLAEQNQINRSLQNMYGRSQIYRSLGFMTFAPVTIALGTNTVEPYSYL